MLVTESHTSVINDWSSFLAESVPFCPCPPETSFFEVVEGIPFLEIHVDPDLPFCPSCELAQIDLPVLYSCQCDEVL